jgi:hypothetical protein
MNGREAAEAAWKAWADRELAAADPERRDRAVAEAMEVLDRGGSQAEAAAAARRAAGVHLSPQAAAAEAQQLAAALASLSWLEPRGSLTAAGIEEARSQLAARRAAADATLRSVFAAAPAPVPAAAAGPPGPSLSELFSENSVLILGMTGAFLLVVATVLFELYGATQLGGSVRFAAVGLLAAAFGLAGWGCLRSVRLRVVGHVYLAVFALLVPLTCVAAYTFLELGRQGISIPTAIGLSGLSCALLYSSLSARMRAAPYAWLALAALLAGWTGGADAIFGQPWAGPVTAALVPVCEGVVAAAPRRGRTAHFQLPAMTLLHTPWVPALLLAVPPLFDRVTPAQNQAITAALAVVAAGYLAHTWLQRRAGWLVLSAAALTAALGWLDGWQNWGAEVAAVQFVVLAGILTAVSWWAPGVGSLSAPPLRVAALAEVGLAAVLQPRHALPTALALLAASALLAAMAWRQRNPLWLGAATVILAMAWYWSAVALLPPPKNPSTDTLAQVYAPLPALVGLAGIALRRRLGAYWGYALQGPAAFGGLAVAAVAAGSADFWLAGWALVVYGTIAYLAGALGRSVLEVAGGLLAAAAGAMALLYARSSPEAAYVLAGVVAAGAVYAFQEAWRAVPALALTHRVLGLAGLGLVVVVDLAVPDLYARHGRGDLAAVVAALALAGVLAADARLQSLPLADYAAAAAVGLAPIWLSGWLGATESIWYAAGPGLVLVAAGLRLPHDRRLPRRPLLDRSLVAVGAAVLLGPEAFQAAQPDALAGPHLVRLLVGGVAALLVGIGVRSRVLVVAGSIAVVLAALRALFMVLETVQPYLLFGAIALLLLVGAAVLAGLRERVGGARSALATSWSDWN